MSQKARENQIVLCPCECRETPSIEREGKDNVDVTTHACCRVMEKELEALVPVMF